MATGIFEALGGGWGWCVIRRVKGGHSSALPNRQPGLGVLAGALLWCVTLLTNRTPTPTEPWVLTIALATNRLVLVRYFLARCQYRPADANYLGDRQ